MFLGKVTSGFFKSTLSSVAVTTTAGACNSKAPADQTSLLDMAA